MRRRSLRIEEMGQESRHGVGGYHHAPMRGVSRGHDDQRPIIPKAKPLLQPLKERELQEFREALISRQWKDGKLRPSEASPTPTELQARCSHPPDRFRWAANGEWSSSQVQSVRSQERDLLHPSWSVDGFYRGRRYREGEEDDSRASESGAFEHQSEGEVRLRMHRVPGCELRRDWLSRSTLQDHEGLGWQ